MLTKINISFSFGGVTEQGAATLFVNGKSGDVSHTTFGLLDGLGSLGGNSAGATLSFAGFGPTGPFTVPTDTPLGLFLSIQAQGNAGFNGKQGAGVFVPGRTDSTSDFGGTFSLATSGPVFSLPAGFTVNSIQANIEDNLLVPEPGDFDFL